MATDGSTGAFGNTLKPATDCRMIAAAPSQDHSRTQSWSTEIMSSRASVVRSTTPPFSLCWSRIRTEHDHNHRYEVSRFREPRRTASINTSGSRDAPTCQNGLPDLCDHDRSLQAKLMPGRGGACHGCIQEMVFGILLLINFDHVEELRGADPCR